MAVLPAQGRGVNVCNTLIGKLKGESLWETTGSASLDYGVKICFLLKWLRIR